LTSILRYYKAERALKAKYGKGKVHEQMFDIALSMSGHGYGFMVNNKYYNSYDVDYPSYFGSACVDYL
jgi:hypothetical protein